MSPSQKLKKKNILTSDEFRLELYLGTWYEIAHLGNRIERNLEHITAQYTLTRKNNVRMVIRGYNYVRKKWRELSLFVIHKSEASFRSSWGYPFIWVNFNVVYVNENATLVAVGGNHLKYLWIMCKKPEVPEDDFGPMLELLRDKGYDLSKLVYTTHEISQ